MRLPSSRRGESLPPAATRDLRDLLYWEYANIIADSAGVGKRNYGFVMERFQKLQSGGIASDSIRVCVNERDDDRRCPTCGCAGGLTLDHLFPRPLSGPEDEKNAARVCRSCHASKGVPSGAGSSVRRESSNTP